jgi:hypothetical protein
MHRMRIAVLLLAVALVLFNGHSGVIHSVVLLLVFFGPWLRIDRIPGMHLLGETSGTIYVYHAPFVLLPLLSLASRLHGDFLQMAGVLAACFATIGICVGLHLGLKDTPAKVILL